MIPNQASQTMNTMLEPMLNSVVDSFVGEAGREPHQPEKWAPFPGLSPERHNFDYAWSADRRGAATPGFGFAQRGIPPSPLHDV